MATQPVIYPRRRPDDVATILIATTVLGATEAGISPTTRGRSPHGITRKGMNAPTFTSTGAISSFSNYGSTTIDIGAPGSGIYSTVPVSAKGAVVAGYASYSGTSMDVLSAYWIWYRPAYAPSPV